MGYGESTVLNSDGEYQESGIGLPIYIAIKSCHAVAIACVGNQVLGGPPDYSEVAVSDKT